MMNNKILLGAMTLAGLFFQSSALYEWDASVEHLDSGLVRWTRITGPRQVNIALKVTATGDETVKIASAKLWTEGSCRLVWRDAPWDNQKRIKQRGKKIWKNGEDVVTYHSQDTGEIVDPYESDEPNELRLVGNPKRSIDPDAKYYKWNGVWAPDGQIATESAVMVTRDDTTCVQCKVWAELTDEHGYSQTTPNSFRVKISNGPACS